MISVVLAIETSCDDTSVAIVKSDGYVLAQVSASQDQQHELYGGIVPEIASRNHSLLLLPLVQKCLEKAGFQLDQIDGFAVTNRPGLIGSLIVGLMTTKSLALSLTKPYIGVNHLEGHILAPFLKDDDYAPTTDFSYPYISLAVSGGHTSLYLVKGPQDYTIIGMTKDDAAGEAFDKFAKMMGLGFPGGVRVDKNAILGNREAYDFPRSLIFDDHLMMSFSGLKSSAQRLISSLSAEEIKSQCNDLCASFQESIVDVLITKLLLAAKKFQIKNLSITGGVSANSRLRHRARELEKQGYRIVIPPLRYCTDNAAMIGYAGLLRLQKNESSNFDLGPMTASLTQDFKLELR